MVSTYHKSTQQISREEHSLRRRNQRAIIVGDAHVELDDGPVIGVVLDVICVAIHAQSGVVDVVQEAANGAGIVENSARVDSSREAHGALGLDSGD